MKKLDYIFLDFDRTIFDHPSMYTWIDNFLSQKFNLNPGSFKDSIIDHHKHMPEGLRLYEHVVHYQQMLGRSWSYMSAEIQKELHKQHKDFCYPESHSVITELLAMHEDVRIVTYGDGEYQRFKLGICEFLRNLNLPVHVVDEPKRLFIEREFPDTTGILVDDKHPQNLPDEWVHLWLDRGRILEEPEKIKEREIVINSLKEVKQVIHSIIDQQ